MYHHVESKKERPIPKIEIMSIVDPSEDKTSPTFGTLHEPEREPKTMKNEDISCNTSVSMIEKTPLEYAGAVLKGFKVR